MGLLENTWVDIKFRGFCIDYGKTNIKVKDKEYTGCWFSGGYAKLNDTTFLLKTDYDKYPENSHHYIVYDRMTDWGLPNKHSLVEVMPETVGMYLNRKDIEFKEICEDDILVYTDTKDGAYKPFRVQRGLDGETHNVDMDRKPLIIGNVWENPELLKLNKWKRGNTDET